MILKPYTYIHAHSWPEIFGFNHDLRFGQDSMGKSLSDNIAYAQFRLYSTLADGARLRL